MYEQVDRSKKSKNQTMTDSTLQRKVNKQDSCGFVDNRSAFVTQKKLQKNTGNEQQTKQPTDSTGQKAVQFKIEALASPPLTQHSTVVQRVINHVQPIVDPAISQREVDKLNEAVRYLRTSLAGVPSGAIQALFLHAISMPGTNPADTHIMGQAIQINIADWFLKISSVGDIAGMVAHEIGVHTLADRQMTRADKSEEGDYEHRDFSLRIGLHTHTLSAMPNPDTDRRQGDHVNVAKDLGGRRPHRNVRGRKRRNAKGRGIRRHRLDKHSINTRAEKYAATVLRLGDAIEADGTIGQHEKDRRLHDLLNSYLFDLARILVTDDHGIRVIDKSFMVAQAYAYYKRLMIGRHAGRHRWLNRPEVQPTASGAGLFAYLGSKAVRALQDQSGYIGHGTRVGGVIDAVTGGLSTASHVASDFLADYTPDVIKKGAGYAGAVLRGTDRVLGEVPSFIAPKVVDGAAWVGGKVKGLYNWMRG